VHAIDFRLGGASLPGEIHHFMNILRNKPRLATWEGEHRFESTNFEGGNPSYVGVCEKGLPDDICKELNAVIEEGTKKERKRLKEIAEAFGPKLKAKDGLTVIDGNTRLFLVVEATGIHKCNEEVYKAFVKLQEKTYKVGGGGSEKGPGIH